MLELKAGSSWSRTPRSSLRLSSVLSPSICDTVLMNWLTMLVRVVDEATEGGVPSDLILSSSPSSERALDGGGAGDCGGGGLGGRSAGGVGVKYGGVHGSLGVLVARGERRE